MNNWSNKKKALLTAGIVLVIVAGGIIVALCIRYGGVSPVTEPEEEKEKEVVPPIEDTTRNVIPEESEGDGLPDPEVTETTDEDGNVTQTPNWQAQKESAASTVPESKSSTSEASSNSAAGNTSRSSSAGSASKSSTAGGTPKEGEERVIDGKVYGYFEGFGWVEKGDGGGGEVIDAPTTGNIVGH